MGQYLRVNGDYNIKTKEGGQIVLDTGPGVGDVRVTGNLTVVGDTLTVTAENLNVQDNIIVVNYGETGPGVTLDYSGLEVDRGNTSSDPVVGNALLIYEEDSNTWIFGHGNVTGTISLLNSKIQTRQIKTDSDVDSGNLILIGDSSASGVVHVSGTVNYEQQVTAFGDDAIPNKKYVDDSVQNNPTFQIVKSNTRVVTFDKEDPLDPLLFFPPAVGPYTFQPADSIVSVVVDGQINSVFYNNRAIIQGLEFNDTEITNDDTNSNIFIRTSGTGKLQTNYAFQLDKIGVVPASVGDSVVLYAATPSIAQTGVYFVNSDRTGELINKNKALLFSMIF
jgi:hypothetical protein